MGSHSTAINENKKTGGGRAEKKSARIDAKSDIP